MEVKFPSCWRSPFSFIHFNLAVVLNCLCSIWFYQSSSVNNETWGFTLKNMSDQLLLVCNYKFVLKCLIQAQPHRRSLDRPAAHYRKNPCCRQMPTQEKVNCKQRDKAGTRVSRAASDLAFGDVSISLLAHSVQLSALLLHMRDTRPIRACRIYGGGAQVASGLYLFRRIRNQCSVHAVRAPAVILLSPQ